MTDHSHAMEHAGLVETRAVRRCVAAPCELSYTSQPTEEEQNESKLPNTPREWISPVAGARPGGG